MHDRRIEAPTSFRAASTTSLTSRRANTRALCMAGSRAQGWTAPPTGRTRCVAPKAAQIYRKAGNLRAFH